MKLFLFKAVGNYFGGVAGAVAETETQAIERLKGQYLHGYNFYTAKEVDQLYDLEGGFHGENGFTLLEDVPLPANCKDIIFCETYEE